MRSMIVRIQGLVLFVGMIAALGGCGGGGRPPVPPDPDALPTVECKVKVDGKENGGLIITLHPEDGSAKVIVSRFDPDSGSYQFVTKDQGKQRGGVPVGKYTATVKPGFNEKIKIAAKYADPKKSGLTLEVAKGNNTPPAFELTP